MTRTILSLVGLIAIGIVAYTFATGKKPDFVVEAEKNALKEPAAQTQQQPAAQPTPTQTPDSGQTLPPATQPESKPAEKKINDPNDPTTWDTLHIRKDPKTYFEFTLEYARKSFDEMRAKEAELRVKQKQAQRKVDQKQAEANSGKKEEEKAKKAIAEANEKYKDHPEKWVVDYPYKGARTTREKMKGYVKKIRKRSEMAQLVADKTNGVNVLLQSAIKSVSQKVLDIEMAIEQLDANYKIIQTEFDVEKINLNGEEIANWLDKSETYMEMDGADKAFKILMEGSAVEETDAPLLDDFGL